MICQECGAEIEGAPSTCPSCGRDLTDHGGKRRVLALVVGIILLVIAVLLILGGIFLVTMGSGSADSEGYRWSSAHEIVADSHAGVVAGLEVDPKEYLPPFLRMINPKDLASIKVR